MKKVTVAATQMACSWNVSENIDKAEQLVREAAAKGAQIILLQELFETPYFCIEIEESYHKLASVLEENEAFQRMTKLAKELEVVLPFSWFEKAGTVKFNSLATIDADGSLLGVYRKTHIPDSDGYLEKYYFSPGDTGFKVWNTRYAKIGVGICWDQWFPETARSMALQGAELLFFPTAIGSEPSQPELDSQPHWQCVMQGHAAANQIPVIASNRIGTEQAQFRDLELTFFGSSFIANYTGEILAKADRTTQGVLIHEFDLDGIAFQRSAWGLFRDRRPEHYKHLLTLDGQLKD
ncbi:N-carbamoylputrescine amidase [Vibrio parahaemolyticus]|uniref:N-carbamoylputrescine amidase n=1 Tax=Vibrio parahaemolyticus TaxID=670 RepID=UPI00111D76F3|nr:N-carbamoylputrescine amidase [Vibrio parahaemolyticus]TOC44660.1 N-carbamoylputrescine amidase [Vibrio parahaemolyticus]TOL97388.1 N-carbamoylputrescine amidase [Vibrio parahaemolyticus]TOM15834.1 N-carbamoylputrescine amidase [Vibrio parahaemolyticus]